jgi:putative ABC transport system permease protein
MNGVIFKDLFREMGRSWARFVSIFAIVLVSVAFFSGIRATAPDMRYTADQYFDEYNLMDVRVLGTLGITNDDIGAIAGTRGVKKVQPGYFVDAVSTINSMETVFRLHSMPSKIDADTVNKVQLTQGRYPEKSGECLLEESSILDLGLKVGDTIKLTSGKEKPLKEDALKTDAFTIVGKAITPYYLTYEKGSTEIGNGKVTTFLFVREEDFIYPVYTEALVTIDGDRELNTYSPEYDKVTENVTVALDNLGVDRSSIRLADVKAAATKELDKAKAEYADGKAKFDSEIAQGEADLNKAQMDLVEGQTKLDQEKKSFEAQTAMAERQISEGRSELARGERAYSTALTNYNKTMADYGDQLKELDDTTKSLNKLQADAKANKADLQSQLNDPNVTDNERENLKGLISQYNQIIALADDSLKDVNDMNDLAQSSVSGAKKQLKSAKGNLNSMRAKLRGAENELAAAKAEANAKFAQAEADLAEGRRKYEEGRKELDAKKAEGQKKLDEGMEKIVRAENEIEKISGATWYVLDRHSHFSFADFESTTKSVDSIATVFPIFFFLVAALVCSTTMTRMVTEQRGNIGTYKALGYDDPSIAVKFVIYAAIASAVGAVAGSLAGMQVFPRVIYQSWLLKYTMPPLKFTDQVPLILISIFMGIAVTTVTTYLACNKELKETPSLLMRPKAPKAGKIILLERVTFLWRRFTFSQKVTARNIFRYKKRFFMTIIGIAGCTALLLAGFGLNNSISQVVNKQFKEIFSYDLNLRYKPGTAEEGKAKVEALLKSRPEVASFMPDTELNAKTKLNGKEISATLIVAKDTEMLKNFITLRQRATQQPIPLGGEGVVITEKLSTELGVGVGDAFELDNGDGASKKVKVSAITENYVFHYIYMSEAYYSEVYRLASKPNSLMIRLSGKSAETENNIARMLIGNENVASVTFYSSVAANFAETVKSMNSIVVVIIACAGLLAFIVLYNLTNINIGERLREIATIKVLGFFNREVYSYVFRENFLLTLIGAVIGLGLGIVLHRFIMVSIEQEGIMFGNYIQEFSFGYALVITLFFAQLVSVFMNRGLKKIPMVESLKSVE